MINKLRTGEIVNKMIYKKEVVTWLKYYASICFDGLEKNSLKTSVSINNIPFETQIQDLPNVSTEFYRYIHLFGVYNAIYECYL
jgi:hypothetical protein